MISAYDPFLGGADLVGAVVGEAEAGEGEEGLGRLVPRYGTARADLDVEMVGLSTCFVVETPADASASLPCLCLISPFNDFALGTGNESSALRF